MWLCVHKLCVHKLCVDKLCVSKLREDKLCVHKLCVDKCVEHAQNEASCRGHGNWLRATVHVVVASPPGFLRALLGPWHAPSYRCWARGCNCTTYTTTYMYVSMPTCCRHVQYVNASPYACTAVYACMNVRR